MTAVVGILSKKAVAIAADSAVTLSNGKIFNKANKIFTLSKYHPIGVMIHNNDSLMGTHWETIIKIYRQQLDKKSFDTVEEYQNDFISFIKNENFFCDEEIQKFKLMLFCFGIANFIINEVNSKTQSNDDFLIELKREIQQNIDTFSNINDTLPDFLNYTFEEFEKYVEPKIQEVFEEALTKNGHIVDDEALALFKKAFYFQLIKKEYRTTSFTGLVFTGFGNKEIFPSLVHLHIFIGFDSRLRYFINTNKCSNITHNKPSDICTFAQSDVMFTILRGVAPDLQESYNLNFKDFIAHYNEILLSNYTNPDKGDLKFLLERVDKDAVTNLFTEMMQQIIQKKYIDPLFDAVASLSKEDMAEMAESLVYLTYLQRRITNAEESVGGEVDVAIISKTDGFIWIKRKHYFDADLNPNFFKKYFI